MRPADAGAAKKKRTLLGSVNATTLVGAATLLATLASAMLAVQYVSSVRLGEERAALRQASIDLLKAAIDPRFQNKAEEIGRVGSRLVVIDALKGAAVFDSTGSLLEAIGEKPFTTFAAIRYGETPAPERADEARAEFYLAPAVTDTPYHLLIRVDTAEIVHKVGAETMRLRLGALALALVAAAAAALVVRYRVARPAETIARVLASAIERPARADSRRCETGGQDEIGRLARNIDSFLVQFATAWRTKVAVADTLLQSAPIGILQIADNGTLLAANPAAARLISLSYGDDGLPQNRNLELIESGQSLPIPEIARRVAGGEATVVQNVDAARPAYALAGAIRNEGDEDGPPTTVMLLTDVTRLQSQRMDLGERLEACEADVRERARRQFELKLMLEGCLALMATSPSGPDAHVEPMALAESWIKDAQAVGLVSRAELSVEAPSVSGERSDIEAVMRLALLTVLAKVEATPALIVVEGKGINFETAGFTVRAIASPPEDANADRSNSAADWQLALAALRAAIKRVRGQIGEFNAAGGEASVRIVLRGASERMHTGLSSQPGAKG